MIAGAVITAAGRSSRMGAFKPLLKIGDVSAAQRIISTIHAAGIRDIVLVTGNKAEELESDLKRHDVIFLRNDMYEQNEMFDSVKIGLDYLKDKCGKILITPVDVPLFSEETVRTLLRSDANAAIPQHDNKSGHPIVVSGGIIFDILGYDGAGGLRGAITRFSKDTKYIEVNDSGILFDMDTPEDHAAIVRMHLSKTVSDAVSDEGAK